jgi:hypothetical protein
MSIPQSEDLLLTFEDFPTTWRKTDLNHPDDYKITLKPIGCISGSWLPNTHRLAPEYIFHQKDLHNRIFVRTSIKLAEKDENGKDQFLSATFLADTGSPSVFYFCKRYHCCHLPRC